MTAAEYLQLYYPFFFDADDPRHVDEARITLALTAAAAYRPACLPAELQNEAQAHYAAHILLTTLEAAGVILPPPDRVVRREKEGDVEVEYAATDGTGVSAPVTPYQAWDVLAARCRGRGAIISSSAFCGSGGWPP